MPPRTPCHAAPAGAARRGAVGLLALAAVVLLAAVLTGGCGSTAEPTAAAGSEASITLASGQTAAPEQAAAPGQAHAAGGASAGESAGGSSSGAGAGSNGASGGAATSQASAAEFGKLERAREPYTGDGTKAKGQYARGTVLGSDGKPVAGATVSVVINAADPLYKSADGRLVGKATTDAAGRYEVSLATLPRGSIVDISVVKRGYASVLVYGTYDERVEKIDFKNYRAKGGDRRLPVGDQMPPMPFQNLLPD